MDTRTLTEATANMRRIICLGTLVAVGAVTLAAAAYQQKPLVGIRHIKGNLYWIPGGDPTVGQRESGAPFAGGNVAVFVTDKGVVLVDTMFAGRGQLILEQVRSVTDKPVTTIINTHVHLDHSASNIEFQPSVEFIAHENTKAYWSKETCSPLTNCQSFKGENAKFLPRRTYKDRLSLFSGKDRIELYHFGPAHTGGDTAVVFPAVRAMHAGDLFGSKWVPYIDAENGGSGLEFPKTLAKAFAGIKNVDTIITGHMGSLMTWRDWQDWAAYAKQFVTTIEAGVRAGKSVDDLFGEYKDPPGYFSLGGDVRLRDEIQDIYNEVKARP